MPELIAPAVRLRDSWLASRDEWGRDVRQDGAGLRAGDEVDSHLGAAAGGVLEDVRETELGLTRRYWITP